MPKRSKKSQSNKGLLVLMLTAFLGAGGLAAYVRFTPQAAHVFVSKPQKNEVIQETAPEKVDVSQPKPSQSVSLSVPGLVGDDIQFVRKIESIPANANPMVYIINETLQALIVPNARALGVDVKGKVAMMDFNPSILKGYGTTEEGHLIKAFQMALGQFPQIDKFKVVVEGKTIDSLGNIELSTGVDVIRPSSAKAPTTSSGSNPPAPN